MREGVGMLVEGWGVREDIISTARTRHPRRTGASCGRPGNAVAASKKEAAKERALDSTVVKTKKRTGATGRRFGFCLLRSCLRVGTVVVRYFIPYTKNAVRASR